MAFTYLVPEDLQGLVSVGQKVIVPFGQGNSLNEAYVLACHVDKDRGRIKSIHQVVEGHKLSSKQVEGIEWVRKTYLCTYSEAIQVFVPPGSQLIKESRYKLIKPFAVKSPQKKALSDLFKEGDLEGRLADQAGLIPTLKDLKKTGHVKEVISFSQKIQPVYYTFISLNFEADKLEVMVDQLSKRAKKQSEVLRFMAQAQVCKLADLVKMTGSRSSVMTLVDKGYLRSEKILVHRQPQALKDQVELSKNDLSGQQGTVYQDLVAHLDHHKKFLLHGVTGSGKTEVYMAWVEAVLSRGKQVIILVPEIALTPQMVGKFYKRFGQNIAIIHSRLSAGERYDQYNLIASGQVDIVIGARSAIFAPVDNLGLIILDEAHEASYKSDANPKYGAVEVAEYLSEREGIPMVLASATPNISHYYQIDGDYQLLVLNQRFNKQALPYVHLVDMKDELVQGNKSIFSELLLEKIQDRLDKKEQVILFYNKKGFASFVSCRTCGYVMKCPKCDVALTYHHRQQATSCPYCDYRVRVKERCPECSSGYFKFFGSGTERIEGYLKEIFPQARIGRLDSESTSKKGSLEAIIKAMENKEIDILLGTQMVTKGLDFENVTLVGALSADMSLNLPDYLASEKTFQLLTQVAGRAGRGTKTGEVVIQTYTPDHYAIQAAVSQDYDHFYHEEIQVREAYDYPPFVDLASLTIVGPDEKRTMDSAFNLHREVQRFIYKRFSPDQLQILGPNPCVIQKINNKFRWQIILKFDKMDLDLVRNIIHYVCITHGDKVVTSDVYIGISMNPLTLL